MSSLKHFIMQNSSIFSRSGAIVISLLLVVIALSSTSCKDSFLTYNIKIFNNTTSDLIIYQKSDNSTFHKIGDVDANSSVLEKGFFIDTEYTLEVRKHDGTVVQTRVFNQNHDADKEWMIN